jgi:HD-GYP domain-containing protein (c-di-GMP phosphodiesterase class II)
MEAIVQVMESTMGARDPYTVGHQQRVTQIACAIGAEMGLSDEQLRELRMAGSLHDLGKVAVPLEILSKPGRLTDIEFAIIKTHPQVGYDILKPLKFSARIGQIILQHHERLDGSGYPQGLKGNDILLEARILGVADVVEAMCSHRPYRPALGLDQALAELRRNRDIIYDPDVVDVCLKLYDEDTPAASPEQLPDLDRRPQAEPNHISPTIMSRNRGARWNGEKLHDLLSWFRNFPFQSRFILHSVTASLVGYVFMVGSN